MKKYILLSLITVILSNISLAQITIYSSDFGSSNDTIRYSHTTTINALSIESTDTNYFWDFSQLTPNSQTMDEYIDINSVNMVYKIAFYGISNLVSPRADMSMGGVSINNSYNFYNKSTNDFRLVGYGGETSATPIPVTFDNPDIIYRFPMTFGNVDSCISNWDINVPGTGYISEELHRHNEVDGWGTIKLPYGQFNCLRLKSTIFQDDSIYLSNTGLGIRVPQYYTVYTWLAKNMNFPIMTATVPQNLIGQVNISYLDSIRQFVGINSSSINNDNTLYIYPNPTTNYVNIKFNSFDEYTLNIINTFGEIIFTKQYNNKNNVNISTENFARGLYFIQITNSNKQIVKKLILK